jgi:glycosyltransferase involved in cell wall biosynthesis
MSPRVSVAIPVYNREKYLPDAIDSILAQTFADFELLIIDDGSTDSSVAVVRSYNDPRIRLICHKKNSGVAVARNSAVAHARGEYLAFLDSDDWAYPQRLAKQVAFLDSHPDCAAVGAWIEWMAEDGRSLRRAKRKPTSSEDIAALRLFQSGIENSASMARTAILTEYRCHEEYDTSEDFDLWARIAAKHKLTTLSTVLVRRRQHPRQVTREKAARTQERRAAIYAAQLDTLGITFTTTDLERHSLLRSMRKRGFHPDLAYLEWAETWLSRLQMANRASHCYPEPAFSQLLGHFWLKACWHTTGSDRWAVWRRFWQSALRKRLMPNLLYSLALEITRQPG